MDYSLSVTRKVGVYTQKSVISVANADTRPDSNTNWYSKMQLWASAVASFDPTDQTVRSTVMNSMTESISENLGNTGSKGDAIITIANTRSAFPKTMTLMLEDVTTSNLAAMIISNLLVMTNMDSYTDTTGYCITSAIIKLHD